MLFLHRLQPTSGVELLHAIGTAEATTVAADGHNSLFGDATAEDRRSAVVPVVADAHADRPTHLHSD